MKSTCRSSVRRKCLDTKKVENVDFLVNFNLLINEININIFFTFSFMCYYFQLPAISVPKQPQLIRIKPKTVQTQRTNLPIHWKTTQLHLANNRGAHLHRIRNISVFAYPHHMIINSCSMNNRAFRSLDTDIRFPHLWNQRHWHDRRFTVPSGQSRVIPELLHQKRDRHFHVNF